MRKYITEFIGTYFLVLTVGMTVVNSAGYFAPIAIGASLMVMIFAGAHISGAHYNPAVTLAVFIRKRMSAVDVIPYMLSQIAGATIAAFTVRYFSGEGNVHALTETGKALLAEVLGTFALAYMVLNVATAKGTSGNTFYGLAIGFTVTAMAYALGPISGGAFNPAVAVGLCILKLAAWGDLWIYLSAAFAGAIIAALVFRINNPEDK